jgi:chorismate dehydratase
LTGLPMVFAVWAGNKAVITPDLEGIFSASCSFGLQRLPEIAAAGGPRRGISAALALEYFRKYIVFELGDDEYRGLNTFLQYAAEFDKESVLGRVEA